MMDPQVIDDQEQLARRPLDEAAQESGALQPAVGTTESFSLHSTDESKKFK
jgi:hypothetical protein